FNHALNSHRCNQQPKNYQTDIQGLKLKNPFQTIFVVPVGNFYWPAKQKREISYQNSRSIEVND
ncbi:MAG: hypothetical protein ACO265_07200, partial [Polynucleobacter sp.]